MKRAAFSVIALLLAVSSTPAPAAGGGAAIKKCKDATGKWHYGDNAAAACANSTITVINNQGIKKDEIAAPLTDAELKQSAQRQAEAKRAEEQAKRDQLLLATYSHEADIAYIRDRKVAQLESMIKASTDTLNPLRASLARIEAQAAAEQKSSKAVSEQTAKELEQTHSQIAKHEAAIAQRREEQAAIKAQAERDLERFRQLKSGEGKAAASGKR